MANDAKAQSSINSVLIIDDDEIFCNLLKTLLTKLHSDLETSVYNPADSGSPSADFDWGKYDLLLLDYDLGDGKNGIELLSEFFEQDNFPPTVILTAQGNEDIAVKAIRCGAYDYINKQKLSIERLGEVVSEARKSVKKGKKEEQKSSYSNKEVFYRKLEDTLKKGSENDISFLYYINFDHYQDVLEKHGILTADLFSRNVTDSIVNYVNKSGLKCNLAQISDSSIAILLSGCAEEKDGEKTAKDLLGINFGEFSTQSDEKIKPGISIGISRINNQANLATLMKGVEAASREASRQPEDRLHICVTGQSEKNKTVIQAIEPEKRKIDLISVIQNNKIQPYFCPCIALSEAATSFNFHFFKVNASIIDESNEAVDVRDLSSLKLENGNPGMIDKWLIRNSIVQALPIKKENDKLSLGLFISLSKQSLGSNDLHEWMENLIKKVIHKGITSSLIFEISPLDFISNKKQIQGFINDMRDNWNVSFSLNNIVKADVIDICVKLGGFEYVSITMDDKNRELINKITTVCKKLGVLTLMYEINDAESLNYAIETGVDFGQGEFIQPASETLVVSSEIIEI